MNSKLWDFVQSYGFAVIVIWWLLHTTSWMLVEGCRLYKATRLKLKRIFEQTVAEE